MIDSKVLNSPIRWAGSKKKILNEMLNAFKPGKDNYIECFLGSGVVLINVLKNNDKLKYKNFYHLPMGNPLAGKISIIREISLSVNCYRLKYRQCRRFLYQNKSR